MALTTVLGATAVQCIPELAKYADELLVFQRTPSAVDIRDNRDTDPIEWKTKIATKPGWQRERNNNFNSFVNNVPQKPEVNMVDDGWTRAPS
jgi:cation diffusion facilitator CzcD-associated flavoprotein CzcO